MPGDRAPPYPLSGYHGTTSPKPSQLGSALSMGYLGTGGPRYTPLSAGTWLRHPIVCSYLSPCVLSPHSSLHPRATIRQPHPPHPRPIPALQEAWPHAKAAYKGGSAFALTLKVTVPWSLP